MEKTAVDWLCRQIYTIQVELEAGNNHLKMKIKQAKEMEKQQIIDAWVNGGSTLSAKNAEQYYNETFKAE